MNPTRRDFGKSIGIGALAIAALGSSFMLGGCNAVADLENWIPVALTAVNNIVKLLGPAVPAPVTAAIALINAGFAAVLTAIQNYKSGSGVLADISNAIAAVESAFQSFFSSIGVPSGLLATIEGLAAIVISTIQAFANEISPTPASAKMTVGGNVYTVAPVKRSRKQFVKDFDAECVKYGHPEASIR